MSTRVQKGGTIFRPIAKTRPRPINAGSPPVRQPSTISDSYVSATSSAIQSDVELFTALSRTPAIPITSSETYASLNPPGAPSAALDSILPAVLPEDGHSLEPTPHAGARSPAVPSRPPAIIAAPSRFSRRQAIPSPGPSIIGTTHPTRPHVSLTLTSSRTEQPSRPSSPDLHSPDALDTQAPSSSSTNTRPEPTLQASTPSTQLDFSTIVEQAARAANAGLLSLPSQPQPIPPNDSSSNPTSSGGASNTTSLTRLAETAVSADSSEAQDSHERSKRKRTRSKRADLPVVQTEGDNTGGADPAKSSTRRRALRIASFEEPDAEATGRPRKRGRRKASSHKSRTSSDPFDINTDPGEELDPTTVTMADICEDTGQGRVSSKATQIFENHTAWKRSNRDRRTRMRADMEARKYGRNEDTEALIATTTAASGDPANDVPPPSSPMPPVRLSSSQIINTAQESKDSDEDAEGEDDGFDYSKVVGGSRFAAQVRIGANGETVIDESSLFVDRTEEHETVGYTHVEESDATKFTNSSTYSKRCHGSRWSAEETELFFDALRQFGENYELISFVLPGRDRKSCKNKFKAEDKKNSARINYCLNNRIPYDMETLSRMTGRDFSGPTPEIRAKTPPNTTTLEPTQSTDLSESLSTTRKKSQTPAPLENTASSRRSSNAPGINRKKSKNRDEEGVEILGAADGDWDN